MPSIANLLIYVSEKSSPRIIAAISRSNSSTIASFSKLYLFSSFSELNDSKAKIPSGLEVSAILKSLSNTPREIFLAII